ncbi:MAG: heat-inducible transcriptional repressor HrcA [Pseudomonadota bacterium]
MAHIHPDLDQRTQHLLKLLVERYINEGQPVSSKSLTQDSGLDLSAATIRNIMADLENMGLIASPHTSAGRIPTAQGYRLFVDNLLIVKPLEHEALSQLTNRLHENQRPQALLNAASQLLSELTHSTGIVQTFRSHTPTLQHIEFVRLSEQRVLLILVTTEGNVQNRLLTLPSDYPYERLQEASKLIRERYRGYTFEHIRNHLQDEVKLLRADLVHFLSAAIDTSQSELDSNSEAFVVSGKNHLLEAEDLSSSIHSLRLLFNALEERTELLQLMHLSHNAQGVQIYIGGESNLLPVETCSLVTTRYEAHGHVMGTLGVIGPTRMAYERIIPIVDMTAQLLSNALSQALPSPINRS